MGAMFRREVGWGQCSEGRWDGGNVQKGGGMGAMFRREVGWGQCSEGRWDGGNVKVCKREGKGTIGDGRIG